MSENDAVTYLKPEVLSGLNNLELIARYIVEGYLTGLHKSPFHGFSVEFSQRRPYLPGDDLKYVDWKVYARSGRYYIKQFEEETNLRCHIILDISKSMQYGSGKMKKSDYASYLSAALAYLMINQRDATGLVLFDEAVRKKMPPRTARSYLNQLLLAIDDVQYGNDTRISKVLNEIAEQIERRGLIILISDLFDDPQEVLNGLKNFRFYGHEIIVFHILDPLELIFDFSGDVLFKDLESNEMIKTQPEYIREEYRRRIKDFVDFYKVNLINNKIDYKLLTTDMPFDKALTEYLLKRKKNF
jgi:uncharacterized protein (DUF58 family)